MVGGSLEVGVESEEVVEGSEEVVKEIWKVVGVESEEVVKEIWKWCGGHWRWREVLRKW